TEDNSATKKDIMIPKERFDEVNEKYKSLKAEIDSLKEAQTKKEEPEQKASTEKVEKEPEANPELEALQAQVNEFQSVIENMVNQKVEQNPEDMCDLVPDGLTHQQKLDWITKAEEKGLFKKKEQIVVGQPLNHSAEQDKAEKVRHMNLIQLLAS